MMRLMQSFSYQLAIFVLDAMMTLLAIEHDDISTLCISAFSAVLVFMVACVTASYSD